MRQVERHAKSDLSAEREEGGRGQGGGTGGGINGIARIRTLLLLLQRRFVD